MAGTHHGHAPFTVWQDEKAQVTLSRLENMSAFEHDGLTNLLFPFEGAELDMGRLAVWRLQTHGQFDGTWLSDYVPNRLGGFVQEQGPQKLQKPDCRLIGEDGNISSLIGIAARTLRQNGLDEQAKEMQERIMGGKCGSYYSALNVIGEYVNITGPEEPGMTMGGM